MGIENSLPQAAKLVGASFAMASVFDTADLKVSLVCSFFPNLGVGLLDFKVNSSPRPELFSSPGLLLAHPWSAHPPSVPRVPNSRVSLECPTPREPQRPNFRVSLGCATAECPRSAQPQVSHPRVSLECLSPECPVPESPWSAQCPTPDCPQSAQPLECPTPEYLYQERVGMFEVFFYFIIFFIFFFFFGGGGGVV